MLKVLIHNVYDRNRKVVTLPCSFEDVKAIFEKEFGFCNVRDDDGFVGERFYTDYGETLVEGYPLSLCNEVAIAYDKAQDMLELREFQAVVERCIVWNNFSFLEHHLNGYLDGSVRFYRSILDFITSFCETCGLSEIKMLDGTVLNYLDNDLVYRGLRETRDVFHASNGCIIECEY